jgi:hypothetical protein
MNNMIDLRNNPAARQQVQAVVRRAAAQQAPAAAAPAPAAAATASAPPAPTYAPPAEPSTAARLQELETLRATGAVSDQEYAAKRQQILSEL